MLTPRKLKLLYQQGQNISAILRQEQNTQHNTEEIIEVSYDLQAGSYIAAMKHGVMAQLKKDYASEIVRTILSLCNPTSILEAGVGEATTLFEVIKSFPNQGIKSYGFDLCWSRVAHAKAWLKQQCISNVTLCTGSLFHIPFSDNSIDVVYTSHSIEPNGGFEEPILRELYRVAKNYLVLLEPGYELASAQARERMDSHGYCKNLVGIADKFGWTVVKHQLFPYTAIKLNPTAITVIKKQLEDVGKEATCVLACPKFKTPLEKIGEVFFSPEALCVYPVLAGIPCLRVENAIVASHYPELMNLNQSYNNSTTFEVQNF
ncbi:MAG: class I SAM-dependent methyltransferase [Moorea sp. SIOASIH]|uniref:class I SAM-dependent methyltransferase n=1 Tax=Moorena sp. SIOASIH TaxID=2607817 RepID=UPI0013BC4D21|nr:class I SAM-dependent methyltransferase [Moorena sp. SIOASIH]NEO35161.1 class I SAM-dependent methyltransferase [Moorena sp. SIOASIH]